MKIYYNKDGWVCERYPYDLPKTENFIEVGEEEYNKTLSCEIHKSWRVVSNKLVIEDYEETPPQELAKKELYEIEQWFETTYTQKEQKYNRLITLGKLTDDGKDPAQVLKELYLLAEKNRKIIQDLETQTVA